MEARRGGRAKFWGRSLVRQERGRHRGPMSLSVIGSDPRAPPSYGFHWAPQPAMGLSAVESQWAVTERSSKNGERETDSFAF